MPQQKGNSFKAFQQSMRSAPPGVSAAEVSAEIAKLESDALPANETCTGVSPGPTATSGLDESAPPTAKVPECATPHSAEPAEGSTPPSAEPAEGSAAASPHAEATPDLELAVEEAEAADAETVVTRAEARAAADAAEERANTAARKDLPGWARDEDPPRRAAKAGGGYVMGAPPRRFDVKSETEAWLAHLDERGYVRAHNPRLEEYLRVNGDNVMLR